MLTVIALLVAYDAGGAALVGLVALARQVPAIAMNLLVDTGRLARPERALVAVYVVRIAASGLMAVGAATGSAALVFAAVATSAGIGSLARPTKMALLPSVAVAPEELVAANVAGALGQGLGIFAGPLLAGLGIATLGPAATAGLAAALAALAAVVVLGVRVSDAARPARPARGGGPPARARLRALAARRPAAARGGAGYALSHVRGALLTYLAVLAIEVLGMGRGGVGLLNAAIGLGALVGALGALAIGVGRGLAPMHVMALILWGLPIIVMGVVPDPRVALGALGVVGVGAALGEVATGTLLQRGLPGAARAATFSTVEVGTGLGSGLGGVAGSLLIASMGIETALVLTGLVLPVVGLVCLPFSRRLDAGPVIPERQAAILRGIPLFRPLPLAALERVAGGMRPVAFAPGERLMTEGEPGDCYLIIERGTVEVSAGGRVLQTQGPGDGIGEIALIRAVPRTATVDVCDPLEGWVVDCSTFLGAVTGHEGSAAAADQVVRERLSRGAAPGV